MKMTLLGYRGYEFKDKEDGREVKGVSLFTMNDAEGVVGHEAGKISVKSVPANIDDYLGCEIDVEFGKYGKVVQVRYPAAVGAAAGDAGKRGQSA